MERRLRHTMVLLVAVTELICTSCLPVTMERKCLHKINCILKNRKPCTFGSDVCGPCMPQFQEDSSGNCKPKIQGDKPDFNHPEEMIDFLNKMMISGGRMTRGKKLNHTNTVSPPGLTTQATPAAPLPTTPPAPLPQILTNSTAARATLSPASVNPPNGNAWRVREKSKSDLSQTFSLTLMVICVLTGVSGILVAALCWYRLQKEVQLAQKMAYTAYKGSRQHTCQRSAPEASHYKWQYRDLKKQHQAQEGSRMRPCQQLSTDSEGDIEEFTMYECPGLAPAGEMEVHNPLFDPSRSKQ